MLDTLCVKRRNNTQCRGQGSVVRDQILNQRLSEPVRSWIGITGLDRGGWGSLREVHEEGHPVCGWTNDEKPGRASGGGLRLSAPVPPPRRTRDRAPSLGEGGNGGLRGGLVRFERGYAAYFVFEWNGERFAA